MMGGSERKVTLPQAGKPESRFQRETGDGHQYSEYLARYEISGRAPSSSVKGRFNQVFIKQ
jgi:hypothetical protein